ncbi:hypothetical protein [Glutamicibacter sp. TV12E]
MDFNLVHLTGSEPRGTVQHADFGLLVLASLDPSITLTQTTARSNA